MVTDSLLLGRLAIAAAAAVERYGPALTTMSDPALVELAISSDSEEAARARALRLLGFAAHLPVRVVAVRSQLPLDQIGGLLCPTRPVKAAPLDDVGVVLATTVDTDRLPFGVRAGIGAADTLSDGVRPPRTPGKDFLRRSDAGPGGE